MKKTTKFISLRTLLILIFSLVGCDGSSYKSSYNAVGFVHHSTRRECSADFISLDGTFVFKLNYDGEENKLYYEASVASGNVNIYYDSLGLKEKLFTAEAGYPIEGNSGYVERGTVYIILEAEDAKNGSIKVRIGE